jgi:hypothetical protein
VAGKRKKERALSLVPSDIEEQLEQGVDPREHMTAEQIQAFIQEEEIQLAKRIGKFAVETVQPDTTGLEEENEEEETFVLDLEKKTIEQKVDAIIVGDEGLIDKVLAVQANPFTDLITGIFVSKALGSLLKKIREEQDKVEAIADNSLTAAQAKALREVSRVVFDKQLVELRACWITGTNNIKFDKVPEWAIQHINEYINEHLRSLINFSED